MAAQYILAFTFLTVTLLGKGFGVADEEFQKVIGEIKEEIHEMSKMLKTQELENIRQGEVINRLEEALISSDRKCKSEVQEIDEVQNITIEERVSLIELQVADLDVLFDEQVIQEKLLKLEGTSDQTAVELAEINANIEGLQVTDVNHDARISALEENGGGGSGSQNDTIAFHSALTSYSSIPDESTLIFNEVLLNEGDGYDSTTGVFTVPYGGDGIYYFSVYLLVEPGEYASFDMTLNDDRICTAYPDHSHNGDEDLAPGSCSAVVDVTAGDEVHIVLYSSTDTTPLWATTISLFSGFNGFRI